MSRSKISPLRTACLLPLFMAVIACSSQQTEYSNLDNTLRTMKKTPSQSGDVNQQQLPQSGGDAVSASGAASSQQTGSTIVSGSMEANVNSTDSASVKSGGGSIAVSTSSSSSSTQCVTRSEEESSNLTDDNDDDNDSESSDSCHDHDD
jgi:hypothetical protein